MDDWLSMDTAPKDRTPILVKMRDDVFPAFGPERLERWNGRYVVVSHPGTYEHGGQTWDHGWDVAAPVGYGGLSAAWMIGWKPVES